MLRSLLFLLAAAVGCAGCEPPAIRLEPGLPASLGTLVERDFELDFCRTRIAEVEGQTALPGTPGFDRTRAEVLGRAVGEPAVFVETPSDPVDPLAKDAKGWGRVARVKRMHRHDKPALRKRMLRDGYVFSDNPLEAYALVRDLKLQDLFDDDVIYLQRGEKTHRLEKARARYVRGHEYRFTEGAPKGFIARILFGDRVAQTREELADPLHRDVRALRDRAGFDRMRIHHLTASAMVTELRFDGRWFKALVTSQGAELQVSCLDASPQDRQFVVEAAKNNATRRRAIARLQASVDALVGERLPFDRPREAEDHFSDGHLRPLWNWAYKRGAHSFSYEEKGYLVFDREGRPHPPQTCVEMVLDSYERASGNWFGTREEQRGRGDGGLNFSDFGIRNRAGVLAFEKFAEETPALFVHRRIPQKERVPFRDREKYFTYLVDHADAFAPGDIVAIQGRKRDGYIHQHAILIKDTDPITGMPHALADQMKRPRDRTWEGIMAEAPARSLLYHVKPTAELLDKIASAPVAETTTASR